MWTQKRSIERLSMTFSANGKRQGWPRDHFFAPFLTLRYFFFYAKQLPRIYLRGKLFRKLHNSAVSFWTVLRFRSSSWFYVVVAVFVLIFRSHKSQYNGSISLAKSGSRHCTLQRNYSAAPHETGRLICSVYGRIIRRSTTVTKAYCFNGYVKKKKTNLLLDGLC